MDAQNISHPEVTTALHRDEARGRYMFGVILHGEFIPLLEHKLGRIDKWVKVGKQRQNEQRSQQSETTQPPQPQQ